MHNALNAPTMTTMNVERILKVLNGNKVAYLLIGGVNFLLRHKPVLTYDVDVWIEDTEENLARCEKALARLKAEWGGADDDWRPVAERGPGWLRRQSVYCLISPAGALDVFRAVKGLKDWRACHARAVRGRAGSVPFRGLSDKDMLRSQKALAASEQNRDRIRTLSQAIRRTKT